MQHKETGGVNLPFLVTDTCWRPEGSWDHGYTRCLSTWAFV